MNRFLCIIPVLLTTGCDESETGQDAKLAIPATKHVEPEFEQPIGAGEVNTRMGLHPESASQSFEHVEPDYGQLIAELGIEAVVLAMRTDGGEFVESESAGRTDMIAACRSRLDTLDLSFHGEGVLMIYASPRFGESLDQSSSVIGGRCTIVDMEEDELSVSPVLLIRALLEASRQVSREDKDTK
ncbi:hypothetical protein HAHE_41140 [Haloferula helveola]|uniref:Uncharacterized protein n=1 Tax=Haloferula helveola TaxID=490095 RepID=A0ABM7RJC4_9BACT|nr:hypothetical protein HAHE_41140 [Haloferula helveola]